MKIIGVIPARYASTRFPGKPLADICGKPMIWHVYNNAKQVIDYDDVIVATESEKVTAVCDEYGIKSMLTSDEHVSGTDRVTEVAEKYPADWYVVVMGDEPFLFGNEQKKLVAALENTDADAVMLATKFKKPVDVVNSTTIKLAINDNGYLIFMSRSPIPYPKEKTGFDYYKNIGCYAFKRETLEFFKTTTPGNIENIEGLEMLRLIENNKKILTVITDSVSMSVDTPKDLLRVIEVPPKL